MSMVRFKQVTSEIATGTSLKTLAQIVAASNHAVAIRRIDVSFQGTSNTDSPILVEIKRQTTAGTASSKNPVKNADDTDETLHTTGQEDATAEPTAGDILERQYVHPQQGLTIQYPFDDPLKIGGGDRLGVAVNAGTSVNAVVTIHGEE